ncbi:MAG: fibronectin type III domain-containing protein [Candidatus Nanopelagicales bacterium]|nr:fibronectin type III domain-containing protein [Candidatus Nanopelagicales bacterium]
MRWRTVSAAIALTGALALSGTPATAAPGAPSQEGGQRAPATLAVASSPADDGSLTLIATTTSKAVTVTYRDAAGEDRRATQEVRDGAALVTLAPGSASIRVRAKATSKLTASPWVEVSAAPGPQASPGATYRVSPTSPILGKLAGYKSVNKQTRAYYLIRSYMQRFEAAGGGTLILGPGRYVISNTIYVPSNTTIQLSAGTTLVKGTKTGTRKFPASNSMFMLIERSRGKEKGAVGGHEGAAGITITGAGEGRSVIDLAEVRDSLAIIAGHNRDVTISGISFLRMNNNHFIEMDACLDCEISGNEFLGAARGSRDTAEAINLDTPDPRTRGFGSIWSKQDGTANDRVTITRNRFDRVPRALGTHNFTAREYHSNIVVTGNTITNTSDDAIHIMNWANPVFTGNTISSSSGSVGIRACGTTNPTISGNTFEESTAAVVFRTCRGENGTTRPNAVGAENADALGSNLAGAGLRTAAVSLPGQGTVTVDTSQSPPAGVPSQPVVESVQAADRQATVRWEPALSDDRAPITAYRIRVRTDPVADPVQTVDVPAGATEAIITGLANATPHHVTLAAVNSVGESPTGDWSMSTVTPQGPPSAPRQATGNSPIIGAVGLSWVPPENDGGQPITAYLAQISSDEGGSEPLPGSPVELHPDTTQHVWAGLTEGATYFVRVTAVNALGEGAATDVVAVVARPTPATVPPLG